MLSDIDIEYAKEIEKFATRRYETNPRVVAYVSATGNKDFKLFELHAWLQNQTDVWRKETGEICRWCGATTHSENNWCEHPFPTDVKAIYFEDWLYRKYVSNFNAPKIGDNILYQGEVVGTVLKIEDTICITSNIIKYKDFNGSDKEEHSRFIFAFWEKGKWIKNNLHSW